MALTVGNVSNATAASAGSLTWSHTVGSGNNRLLLVMIGLWGNTRVVTSVTFNGKNLQRMPQFPQNDKPDGFDAMDCWFMVDPDVTTANIVATFGSTNYSHAHAINFTDAFVAKPWGYLDYNPAGSNSPSNSANGSASTATAPITTLYPNSIIVDILCARGSPAITKDASQTQIGNTSDTIALSLGTSYKAAASPGAFTMSWTGPSSNWFHRAIEIREVDTQAYEQEGFKFRNDDGSETTATQMANQDTNVSAVPVGQNVRLRMLLNATSDPMARKFALQYRRKNTLDPWKTIERG